MGILCGGCITVIRGIPMGRSIMKGNIVSDGLNEKEV
jgi:hypothetical protein